MTSKQVREEIMSKAIALVAESNIGELSFDRLAKMTGVSKGGILYHFPTKEALLVALVQHIEQVFLGEYAANLQNVQPHPGRSVAAYLRVFLEGSFDTRIYSVLISVSAELPGPLSHYITLYKQLHQDIKADGGDFARQWALIAALDALLVNETCRIYALNKAEHRRICRYLLEEARAIAVENKENNT